MNRIRLLPEIVANQIAAGEVVERPASVVKELMENSLDAGATRVEIEVHHGGRSLIRISDNGCGMSKDDALLSLERHATSKIASTEDIEQIHTLGFRGEAIPSIAAVCRFHMITREPDAGTGVEIHISGGKLHDVKEVGAPAGTTFEVRNLFFNLPARRKFLRSPATESAHISHITTLHALAHPQVAFRLKQDDRVLIDVAPCKVLLDRVRELYGAQLCQELAAVEYSAEMKDGIPDDGEPPASSGTGDAAATIRVHGFIGKPGVSRGDRSQQHTFVNGRPVDSKTVNYALLEGYHTALMRGRYPVAFLFVEVPPQDVDVNIHPAKREIRFRNEQEVRAIIIEAVRQALEPKQVGTPKSMELAKPSEVSERQSTRAWSLPVITATPLPDVRTDPRVIHDLAVPIPQPAQGALPSQQRSFNDASIEASTQRSSFDLRLLGVIGDLYIIAQSKEGLVLIDQHAAHERVLFEQMLRRHDSQPVPSQKLLLPEAIEVDHRDAAFLHENLETIQHMGIGISEFGERTFVVDSMPPFIPKGNLRQLFRNIVDELREAGREVPRGRLTEDAVATTVCRHAVKAHDPLKTEELIRLLNDLHQCDLPYTCPHGRPTMIQLSYVELEKKFGRKV